MKIISSIAILILVFSCKSQTDTSKIKTKKAEKTIVDSNEIIEFQTKHQLKQQSKSIGTVSNGKLENGCYLPYKGNNYKYFAKNSYLMGRCFINCAINSILVSTFKELETTLPNRTFYLMEASNEKGGKISPHRTHQNGTSIDLMIPLLKENQPYTKLDSIGVEHYLLNFNDKGEYKEDTSIKIDFETLALEILTIEKNARLNNWKISKVILKTEYQKFIFSTKYSDQLKTSKIYFTKKLEKVINDLHDDHIHIDFEEVGLN
jgi:penicillin-insensitive murein endopeptidase